MAANNKVGGGLWDLMSILSEQGGEFLVRSNGDQVPISDLKGKIVFLYFSTSEKFPEFTQLLEEVYRKLKERGESFEIVMASFACEQSSFELEIAGMPWLAIPFNDSRSETLTRYFWPLDSPSLAVIGTDGKTLNKNAVNLVERLGVDGFPFTPEKFEAILEAQTLESILVSGEQDYVIGKGGIKVPVSDLVGKNILLYFVNSAEWMYSYHYQNDYYTSKFIKPYHKIKARYNDDFELVFICESHNTDQSTFNDLLTTIPWLALPFGDNREKSLSRKFNILWSPNLVAIGPTGKTICEGVDYNLIFVYGFDAYPFTEQRIEEIAKEWPERMKLAIHGEHELVRTHHEVYKCNLCDPDESDRDASAGYGIGWCFSCEECDFDLHPMCALDEDRHCVPDELEEGYQSDL